MDTMRTRFIIAVTERLSAAADSTVRGVGSPSPTFRKSVR